MNFAWRQSGEQGDGCSERLTSGEGTWVERVTCGVRCRETEIMQTRLYSRIENLETLLHISYIYSENTVGIS